MPQSQLRTRRTSQSATRRWSKMSGFALLSLALLPIVLPASAAPMGNAIISVAEVLDEGVIFEDLAIVQSLTDGTAEICMNSQYGIGYRTDVGFDMPLSEGDAGPLLSATHMLWQTDTTRLRLGVLGLNSDGEASLEGVLSHDVGDLTLTAGAAGTMPGGFGFGGATLMLNDSTMLHLEYVAGADAEAAVGCEWTIADQFGFIISGLNDFHGNSGLFLNFIWTADLGG